MKLTHDIIRKLILEEISNLVTEETMQRQQDNAITQISNILTRLEQTNINAQDVLNAAKDAYEDGKPEETQIERTLTEPEKKKREEIAETFVDKRKQSADKHFSKSQSPGEADDTWHNCMVDVKKDGKSLESAAKICTKSREEGGATLKWGEQRKKEVRAARPGGMK